ncbi:transcriptional regulator [Methylobacterium radiotolerans]|uniref:transcriptional regulator n=1 Tax=Methylobacterium radiotolerans TaxID=31998 RepID=UPI001F1F12AE|nr:transcriptional regulator [Methylobacterium radiotolerans]UIY45856.1 transcriptional regulator [Methylobacterium radiotolerans]
MFADEIRRAVEASPRVKLPDVAALLWRAFGEGQVSEAEAEEISALIDARKAVPVTVPPAPRRVGSRPRTDASMERRRRWASSGRLPPQLAARFTLAEQAVLAVVAAEATKRGDLRLCHEAVAAIAGVSRSTVRATLRRAKVLGLVEIEERRLTPWRSLPSIVRIVSTAWKAWNRLARRAAGPQSLCVISPLPTPTEVLVRRAARGLKQAQGAAGGRQAEPLGRACERRSL